MKSTDYPIGCTPDEEWVWWGALSPVGASRASQELEQWSAAVAAETYMPLKPQVERKHSGGRPKRAHTSSTEPT